MFLINGKVMVILTMADRLTHNMAKTVIDSEGHKVYTVSALRTQARELVKQANLILYDLDESQKAGYMRDIALDIADISGTRANDTLIGTSQIKYLKKRELVTLIRSLEAFKQADMESTEYAKRLSGTRDRARRKASRTIGKNITEKQYKEMLDMWNNHSDLMEKLGYREVLDIIKTKNKHGKGKVNVFDLINNAQNELGEDATPKQVRAKVYQNLQVTGDELL